MNKPKILITCGDINGIGPEIILKIFLNENFKKRYNLKVIGPKIVFDYYSRLLKIKNLENSDIINLFPHKKLKIKTGKIDSHSGKISGDAIKIATELTVKRKFDAIVTMPINKKALNMGGYIYEGHTDMLADLTGSSLPIMVMFSKDLKVIPLTIHIPVERISNALDKNILEEQIKSVNKIFQNTFGIEQPKLALLGLNPHSGDAGLIGDEEIKILNPLMKYLQSAKINIKGTFSADAFFGNKAYKNYDCIFAMYHDQGLIPFKIIAGKKGVNYTGGLNIIRTSPSHGTAFDIAGKGIADITSSAEAIKLANQIALDNR